MATSLLDTVHSFNYLVPVLIWCVQSPYVCAYVCMYVHVHIMCYLADNINIYYVLQDYS